jgi:conjugative relaxase-like TrwC/TraI family protein
MLSIASLTGGPGYYLELSNLNYYSLGGEPPPLWAGTAAREFGLSGVAEKEHVYRLCAGYDHETGTRVLVRKAGTPERNPGHDLTFSCPKTVSLAWCLGDDEMRKAIEKAQLSAVKQALAYLEDKAGYSRLGTDGQRLVKCPLLFALFEHATSRAMDPQLHTHALLINLTMHHDGHTTAVDSTYMYHFKMAAGAMYRAALAENMVRLGFDIEQRQLGASLGFEIAGIPKELVEEFSKRRAEIEEKLNLHAGSLDAASAKYAELMAKETRRTKETEKPRADLLAEWQAVGRLFGVDENYLGKLLTPHRPLTPMERVERKEAIAREALTSLSEQHSHFGEVDFTKALAERAAGRISARDVRELVENKLRSVDLIPLGTIQTEHRNKNLRQYVDRSEMRFSTPAIRKIEQNLLGDVERIVRGKRSDIASHFADEAIEATKRGGITLEAEQAKAVHYLTSGPGVRLMTGIAGTGKTTTLKTCLDAWRRDDPERLIWGCAVSSKVVKDMRAGFGEGIECDTLQKTLWLLDVGKLKLTEKSIVIVDEAGMLGTKQLHQLLCHIKKVPGARLILVGDAKQLQAIDAGGAFKYLAQEEILGEVRLQVIRRQEEKWARDAVASFEQGKAGDAIGEYIKHKRFHLTETRPEAIGRLVEQWKADGGVKAPENVLLLCSLNVEARELNLKAQAARILAGVVDPEKKIFANGVHFHVGDRLQFQKLSRPLGVVNADCGIVTEVDPERQRLNVRLDDGAREVMVDLKRFKGENLRLGYASTTHKAQGSTVPHVHVLLGGPLSDMHMGYVQISRSVISSHLVCDKHTAGGAGLADLIRTLSHERQKTMAQEIIDQNKLRQPGISLGR